MLLKIESEFFSPSKKQRKTLMIVYNKWKKPILNLLGELLGEYLKTKICET